MGKEEVVQRPCSGKGRGDVNRMWAAMPGGSWHCLLGVPLPIVRGGDEDGPNGDPRFLRVAMTGGEE